MKTYGKQVFKLGVSPKTIVLFLLILALYTQEPAFCAQCSQPEKPTQVLTVAVSNYQVGPKISGGLETYVFDKCKSHCSSSRFCSFVKLFLYFRDHLNSFLYLQVVLQNYAYCSRNFALQSRAIQSMISYSFSICKSYLEKQLAWHSALKVVLQIMNTSATQVQEETLKSEIVKALPNCVFFFPSYPGEFYLYFCCKAGKGCFLVIYYFVGDVVGQARVSKNICKKCFHLREKQVCTFTSF